MIAEGRRREDAWFNNAHLVGQFLLAATAGDEPLDVASLFALQQPGSSGYTLPAPYTAVLRELPKREDLFVPLLEVAAYCGTALAMNRMLDIKYLDQVPDELSGIPRLTQVACTAAMAYIDTVLGLAVLADAEACKVFAVHFDVVTSVKIAVDRPDAV